MEIAFRVDASIQIGAGHVMRCLTLADELSKRGGRCTFISRPHDGHLLDLVAHRGYETLTLPSLQKKMNIKAIGVEPTDWLGTDWLIDAADVRQLLDNFLDKKPLDWLVVDHYGLDARWERALRFNTRKIVVIDDLADRPHDSDLLIDQNLGRNETSYEGLLSSDTVKLIGPEYALLRSEFSELRIKSLVRRNQTQELKHLLISMGGVDKDNFTERILDTLMASEMPHGLNIKVVMGHQAPWLSQVQAKAELMPYPTEVLIGVTDMAQLMSYSDLAVGAVGGSAWERCCLGLPALALITANNQKDGAIALQNAGAIIVIRAIEEIKDVIEIFQKTPQFTQTLLKKMSAAAAAVTDGKGCTRVVDCMIENTYA